MEDRKTCQICGRDIKAKNGVIAHHGYTRPGDGYQTGSCLGARYLPYEESRDRIPAVKSIYQQQLQWSKNKLKDYFKNPPATITRTDFFGKEEEYARPEGFDPEATMKMGSWRYDQRYEMTFSKAVKNIKMNIIGLTSEIEYLQERYDNWKKEG